MLLIVNHNGRLESLDSFIKIDLMMTVRLAVDLIAALCPIMDIFRSCNSIEKAKCSRLPIYVVEVS